MNSQSNSNDGWQPCTQGELIGLVDDLKRRQRNRVLARAGAASVAAMLVVAVAVGVWFSPAANSGQDFGGLTCREVVAHFDDYYAKRLDPDLAARIQLHLANCPQCGAQYQEFIQSRQATIGKIRHSHVLASASLSCPCPSCRHRSGHVARPYVSTGTARAMRILHAGLR